MFLWQHGCVSIPVLTSLFTSPSIQARVRMGDSHASDEGETTSAVKRPSWTISELGEKAKMNVGYLGVTLKMMETLGLVAEFRVDGALETDMASFTRRRFHFTHEASEALEVLPQHSAVVRFIEYPWSSLFDVSCGG